MKTLLLLLLVVAPLAAQSIEGDLVNSVTGAPVAGAHVSINGPSSANPVFAVSDATGHFRIPAETSGYGSVTVVCQGFLSDRSFSIQPDQPAFRIALMPQAVIGGKVEDEDGFPVDGAMVRALRYHIVEGKRALGSAVMPGQTNDLGEFRVAGLSPGRYYLCVSPGSAANWDSRFNGECPSLLNSRDAKAIEASAGQEVNVPAIRMTRHAGVTVSGRVAPADSTGTTRTGMFVLQSAGQPSLEVSRISFVQSDGSFAIRHVPPGSYSLIFNSGQSSMPSLGDSFTQQRIQVADSDLNGITLAPREVQASNLSGKVIAEDGGAPPVVSLALRPPHGLFVTGNSGEDGSFEFKGLLPGHYDIMAAAPLSQMASAVSHAVRASAASLGGREVLESGFDLDGTPAGPLQVTVSARLTDLYGQLLDNAGQPVSGALVLLLGTPGRLLMDTGLDGRFWTGLARPGDYRVYVLTDDSQFALLDDPEYLQAHQADLPPVHVALDNHTPLKVRLPAAR
jgi:hypothetical protein